MNYKTISYVIENNIVKAEKLPSLSKDERLNEILLKNLRENPDLIGIIDARTGETCTYEKLTNNSIRCALWLKRQEIGPGDIVAICSENRIAAWVPFCATFFIGANLNIWCDKWAPETLKYFAKLTKPKIIFANERTGSVLEKIFHEENIVTKLIILDEIPEFVSLDDIVNEKTVENSVIEEFQCHPVKNDDDALVIFSSGTSGMPKGVQHSYRGVLYNSYRFNNAFMQKEKLISSITNPLYWVGTSLQIFRNLLLVYPTIIVDEPTPKLFCEAVKNYKIQWTILGASFLNELFYSGYLDKYDFSLVEEIGIGGAKVRTEILKKIDSVLPNGIAIQGYGLTEFGGLALLQKRRDKIYESSGTITYDVTMKIIDPELKAILGPNKEGEICMKQTHIMKYYLSNPEATNDAIDEDGWLHTGDLGFYDEEGNVFVIDRIKEMIKYKGHHISPNEIENILVRHPKVSGAAVVGFPHLVHNEHTLAFVVATNNSEELKEELFKMASALGEKKPLHKIVFVENLPKVSGNKIHRIELKKMAETYAD